MTQTTQVGQVPVHRRDIRFAADSRRVITRFFRIGDPPRRHGIVERILKLSQPQVADMLDDLTHRFAARHKNLDAILLSHYKRLCETVRSENGSDLCQRLTETDDTRKRLIGAYFTLEYAVEAAAFFNPSIVPHPDQSNLPEGHLRVIISFRAVGEGHISSIVFRSGTADENANIRFDPVSHFSERPEVVRDPSYDKYCFILKLAELKCDAGLIHQALGELADFFTREQLNQALTRYKASQPQELSAPQKQTINTIHWLADSNYELRFHEDHDLSERVIFPVSSNERNGIEDARFVQFHDEDMGMCYYATYTAYNGVTIMPQVIETRDFVNFRIITLNGQGARGKGMALFPRKIDGVYHMIGRQDGENLTIMRSDNLHFWLEAQPLQVPVEPWELMQIGNCGSPIETDAGWLLLTHGVGPMRRYCIGAMLLDKDDPSKVIGRLRHPLIEPTAEEREGYVPNVLYSCGAVIHGNKLIVPYAMSDSASAIATIELSPLLAALLDSGA